MRGAKQAVADKQPDVDVVVAARRDGCTSEVVAPPCVGSKSELPSTFKRDRGGAAEDAELLALLRGFLSQSSASRFSDSAVNLTISDTRPVDSSDPLVAGSRITVDAVASTSSQAISPTRTAPIHDGEAMPLENVPKSLTDKNWKV
jgi:hypothetical protein